MKLLGNGCEFRDKHLVIILSTLLQGPICLAMIGNGAQRLTLCHSGVQLDGIGMIMPAGRDIVCFDLAADCNDGDRRKCKDSNIEAFGCFFKREESGVELGEVVEGGTVGLSAQCKIKSGDLFCKSRGI